MISQADLKNLEADSAVTQFVWSLLCEITHRQGVKLFIRLDNFQINGQLE